MLRPIFYTFCNLTEDKEDSSRRVRAWNEQVSEDRTVDEWNREWIDKIFFFFFSLKKWSSIFIENTRKNVKDKRINTTYTRIYKYISSYIHFVRDSSNISYVKYSYLSNE